MDRILFGDNQFFGVNHMSEEKARQQAMRFQDMDEIMRVLGMHDKFDRRSSLRSNFLTAIGTRPGVSLRLTKRCSRTKGKVVLAREPTPATGSTLRATRGRPGDDQIDQAADEACVDRLSLPERAHVKRAE